MPNRVVTHRVRKIYGRYKKVTEEGKTERGTFSSTKTVKVGEDEVEVTLTVDLDAIVYQIGDRAWHNKSGRAKFMKGAVFVEARKIREMANAQEG